MKIDQGKFAVLLCIAALSSVTLLTAAPPRQEEAPAAARVGTFDSRAVAIAWAASDAFEAVHAEIRSEYKQAQATGDDARVSEIDAEMQDRQRVLHKQGFSTWPVRDILAHIPGEMEKIADEVGVDVIVCKWDLAYRRAGAEFVNVTDAVVARFNPDERTLKMVADIQTKDPVDLKVIEDMDR